MSCFLYYRLLQILKCLYWKFLIEKMKIYRWHSKFVQKFWFSTSLLINSPCHIIIPHHFFVNQGFFPQIYHFLIGISKKILIHTQLQSCRSCFLIRNVHKALKIYLEYRYMEHFAIFPLLQKNATITASTKSVVVDSVSKDWEVKLSLTWIYVSFPNVCNTL